MSEPAKPKFVHKDNSGSLFENSFKRSDDDPDVRGDGVAVCPCCNRSFDFKIKGWWREGKNGRGGWTSFRINPVAPATGGAAPAAKPQGWRPGQQPSEPRTPAPTNASTRPPAARPPAPATAQAAQGPSDGGEGVMEEDDVPF